MRALVIATAFAAVILGVHPSPSTARTAPVPGIAAVGYEEAPLSAPATDRHTVEGVLGVTARGGAFSLADPVAAPRDGRPGPVGAIAWSHDGARIAVVFARNRIAVMDADGTNRRDLDPAMDDVGDLSWSPDGRRLAFVGSRLADIHEANPTGRIGDVFVIGADGSGIRRLTTHEEVAALDWSPRGEIVYGRHALGGRCENRGPCTDPAGIRFDGVWVREPDRPSRARRILRGSGWLRGLSPDGRRFLWHSWPRGAARLDVRDLRGRVEQRLRFGVDTGTWAADGRIAYLEPTLLGSWQVVARRADGSRRAARALPDPALNARGYRRLAMQPR